MAVNVKGTVVTPKAPISVSGQNLGAVNTPAAGASAIGTPQRGATERGVTLWADTVYSETHCDHTNFMLVTSIIVMVSGEKAGNLNTHFKLNGYTKSSYLRACGHSTRIISIK